jgi:hypothetical protein
LLFKICFNGMFRNGSFARSPIRVDVHSTCRQGARLPPAHAAAVADKTTAEEINCTMFVKGEMVEASCLRLAHAGKGACFEEGARSNKVLFVEQAVPGETVLAEVQKAWLCPWS